MIAALVSPDLLVGLALGLSVGLLLGPLVRSWLAWREWTSASREADLAASVLDRMDLAPWSPADEGARDGGDGAAVRGSGARAR